MLDHAVLYLLLPLSGCTVRNWNCGKFLHERLAYLTCQFMEVLIKEILISFDWNFINLNFIKNDYSTMKMKFII